MMAVRLPGGALSETLNIRDAKWSKLRGSTACTCSLPQFSDYSQLCYWRRLVDGEGPSGTCSLRLRRRCPPSPVTVSYRKPFPMPLYSQFRSGCDVAPCDDEECIVEGKADISDCNIPDSFQSSDITTDDFPSPSPDVKRELILLSLPAIASQALEPLAQFMETAYVGSLGPIELASAGVFISIINIISKLFNIPLLSVATSFVAEDLSKSDKDAASALGEQARSTNGATFQRGEERKQLSSVSTALVLAVAIGIFEALALLLGSRPLLTLMEFHKWHVQLCYELINSYGFFVILSFLMQGSFDKESPMYSPAQKFLSLRALGAPAAVVSLALQGILRGFKDTKTPVFCLGVGSFVAVFLFPLLIYSCQLGLMGAAISTVVSQYIVTFLLIWYLSRRVILLPPNLGGLKFGVYLKSGLVNLSVLKMVTTFGMSDIGPWSLMDSSAQSGDMIMRMMARNSMSEKLAEDIDTVVKRLSDSAYEIALSHIKNNREAMDKIVEVLLEKETMTGDEFRAILSEYTEIPIENSVAPAVTASPVAV